MYISGYRVIMLCGLKILLSLSYIKVFQLFEIDLFVCLLCCMFCASVCELVSAKLSNAFVLDT